MRIEQQTADLRSRVDEMMCDIKNICRVLEVESQDPISKSRVVVIANVRKSVRSAEAYVRSTTEIIEELEGSQVDSDHGLSEKHKRAVDDWLATPLPLPSEDPLDNETPAEDALRDFYVIKKLRQLALREFKIANYAQAEKHLVNVRDESVKKYSQRYAWKDETIEMLAVSCIRQKKFVEAEAILEESLTESVDRDTQRFRFQHILAEMYLDKGDLVKSESLGRAAVNGRVKAFEEMHQSSCQSKYLMVRISYALGNEQKLRSWTNRLPDGYWTVDCEEIESLCSMECTEAAENIGNGMFKNLLTEERLGEIESVIATGGLTGGGGYSLIHALAEYGDAAPLRVLLERGADPDARDGDGNAAIHLATAHENAEHILPVLLAHSADIDSRTRKGETPLMIAVKNGRADIVKLLIDSGADIGAKDDFEYNAFHHSAYQERADIVRILLANWADVDGVSRYGRTALHIAADRGHGSVVKVLKEAGANLKLKDRNGKTAMDLAIGGSYDETVRILKGQREQKAQEEKSSKESAPRKVLQKREPVKISVPSVQIRR